MNAAALLIRLGALGVSVTAEGEELRLRPASAIPPDLLAALRVSKPAVLALLTAPANDAGTPPARAAVPAGAAGLLWYLRGTLRCHVRLEDGVVWIGPDHRCPPDALAAAMAMGNALGELLEGERQLWRLMRDLGSRRDANEKGAP